MARKRTINLLQERGAPATLWERAYEWVTNTARVIVIFTEILVLIAFGWRFILDRRLTDLKENIEMKGEILKSLSDQEDEIRLLQAKLTAYQQVWDESSNLSSIFEEVNGYIPQGVEDLTFSLSETKEGLSLSVSGEISRDEIDKLENSIKDSENFSDVTLSTLEGKGEESDSFTLICKVIYSQTRET